jgi:hypothetical protein
VQLTWGDSRTPDSATALRAKVGKSWLSLGLGLSVAARSNAMDTVPVLYLALGDAPRRLQSSMGKILAGQRAASGPTLATTSPPLRQGRQ